MIWLYVLAMFGSCAVGCVLGTILYAAVEAWKRTH